MQRIVPSEVVRAIDKWFPWAKDWTLAKAKERAEVWYAAVTWLPGVVEIIEQIPDEHLGDLIWQFDNNRVRRYAAIRLIPLELA